MVEQITYPRLRELLDAGAQLVVPAEPEYADEHLQARSASRSSGSTPEAWRRSTARTEG